MKRHLIRSILKWDDGTISIEVACGAKVKDFEKRKLGERVTTHKRLTTCGNCKRVSR